MATTSILLTTYNSAKYLREQLESLFAQTNQDWDLLTRDDGSTDDTIEIIKQFSERYPNRIKRIDSNGNLGVIRSFEILLSNCESDYMFFCDHDDFWLPGKVEMSLAEMKKAEAQHPRLPVCIYTDLKVVDENRKIISDSFWRFSRIDPSLLDTFDKVCAHSVATGCTMLINKAAKACSLPFCQETRMHDTWITLCVLKNNGKLVGIETPTILYRQHGDNVIGAIDENKNYIKNRLKSLTSLIDNNKKQWAMIKKLGFKNPLKYVYYKIWYFFKYRQS